MTRAFPFLILMLISTACLQVYNSHTSDAIRYGAGVGDGTPGGQRFAAAYAIVRSECLGCHSHGFETFSTEQQFLDSRYFVPGDHASSPIYLSLRGTGLPVGRQDMPQGGALSGEELKTFREWIDQYGL